jgi:hypothetical protein
LRRRRGEESVEGRIEVRGMREMEGERTLGRGRNRESLRGM